MEQSPPTPLDRPLRRTQSLRFRLNVGLVLIIAVTFAALNTVMVLRYREARRQETMAHNDTVARLIAGGLLGELLDGDIRSPHIKTFLNNFLTASLTLNASNRELAFAMVTTPEGDVVAGRARPDLVEFVGGMGLDEEIHVLGAIAAAEGRLGSSMSVKRFPLKVQGTGLIGRLLVGSSLAQVENDARRELWANGVVFALALALLVTYTTLVLNRLVVRPIGKVSEAMTQVREGNLQVEVQAARDDEIGLLTKSYNFMVRGLRERDRLKDAMSRYVSKQVYDRFLAGEVMLTGETRQATVLFVDIRDFTRLSEQLSPDDVVSMLNEYFSVLVPVVLKYDGLINKFIGDALMAVYNVPLDQDHQALRAVSSALEMLKQLEVLNALRMQRAQAPLRVGMGINTGQVVAGNIGHPQRLEYTVIGDAVNVAQRLEAHTKEVGASLLLSDTTFDLVSSYVQATCLPPAQLKGRQHPVPVFSVQGLIPNAPWPEGLAKPAL